VGVRYFADTALTIVLRPDSVLALSRSFGGAFDISCYECFWKRQVYQTGIVWFKNFTATLKVGADTLRIKYTNPSTAANTGAFSPEAGSISLRSAAGVIRIDLPPRMVAGLGEIRIFSPSGRLISRLEPGSTLFSPGFASGVVYVQFVLRNGESFTRAILLNR
jgi:hypothetical protein